MTEPDHKNISVYCANTLPATERHRLRIIGSDYLFQRHDFRSYARQSEASISPANPNEAVSLDKLGIIRVCRFCGYQNGT
jgi:hypothetical protein